MFLQAQEVAKAYARDEAQTLYMAPAMFLRVFTCYRKLLKERQAVVKDISSRYEAGLAKIKQTQDAIYRYHQELEERSPVLQAKHDAVGHVMEEIEEEFARITGQREQLKRDEFEAAEQAEQALKIKEECEETLNKIVPSLNEAMNSVEAPSKGDIAELRALKKPPKVVKLVLQTVCMLLDVPPAEKKSRKTGRLKLSYWQAAQGKHVLGNPRLPELLVEFDRNKLTPEIMMEVEEVLTQGGYSYEKAHTACAAATGIFKWVKATREYFYIFKEIEPRRDAFMQSQKQYEEKKKQLQDKADQIHLLDSAL
jgi:dynein heavy chain